MISISFVSLSSLGDQTGDEPAAFHNQSLLPERTL